MTFSGLFGGFLLYRHSICILNCDSFKLCGVWNFDFGLFWITYFIIWVGLYILFIDFYAFVECLTHANGNINCNGENQSENQSLHLPSQNLTKTTVDVQM